MKENKTVTLSADDLMAMLGDIVEEQLAKLAAEQQQTIDTAISKALDDVLEKCTVIPMPRKRFEELLTGSYRDEVVAEVKASFTAATGNPQLYSRVH